METNRKILIASLVALVIAGGLWFRHRPAPAVAVIPAAPPVVATQPAATMAPQLAPPPSPRPQEAKALRPTILPQSPLVAKLLSPDPVTRTATLRSFTRHLSTNDIATLVAFLESHPGDYAGLKPIAFNAVKNDVLDVLVRQDKPVVGLGTRLVAMLKDPAQDDIWRDYCVQYLAPYYTSVWPAPNEALTQGRATSPGEPQASERTLSPEQATIQAAYWDAVASTKTIAGTALLGLEQLSRSYPEFDRERVAKAVMALADDESTGEPTRITALRLCGMMGRKEALETARIVAQTGTTIPLRMAAIATLGDLGEQQDFAYLQGVVVQESPRLKRVMESAMKAIQTRIGRAKG